MLSSFKLEPYQETTVQYGIKNPYCIFALKMGLGKTLAALETWDRIKRPPLLVVCPGFLRSNWVAEIRKFYGPKVIITNIKSSKEIYELFDTDICLISYDLISKAETLFKWAKFVVMDEAHLTKSMESRRTYKLHQFIYEYSIPRVVQMTGTPILNRVWEFYSLLSLCYYNPENKNPVFLKKFPSYVDFADHFSYKEEYTIKTKKSFRSVVKYSGIRKETIPELRSYLENVFISFGDEALNLPESKFVDFTISDKENPKLWEAFLEFTNSKTGISPTIKQEAALEKVPFTYEYVSGLLDSGQIEKAVIYTDHTKSCELLAEKFGVKYIHGGVSVENRAKIAHDFIYGNSSVLIATYGSFSTGVNLTVANNLFLNDFPWVPGVLDQTLYRIKRKGQTKTCFFHRILGSPQDLKILTSIKEKRETIEKAIGIV